MSFWDFKASFYDRLRRWPIIRRIHEREKKYLSQLLEPLEAPPVIVDLGTGTGASLDFFPDSTLIGLDSSLQMIRSTVKLGIAGVAADACRLPIQTRSIPFVSAIGLTEYLRDIDAFMEEIRRVLRSGGIALVTISPPVLLNRMRTLLGHRLHLIRETDWESSIRELGFVLTARERSAMQTAFLIKLSGPSSVS